VIHSRVMTFSRSPDTSGIGPGAEGTRGFRCQGDCTEDPRRLTLSSRLMAVPHDGGGSVIRRTTAEVMLSVSQAE